MRRIAVTLHEHTRLLATVRLRTGFGNFFSIVEHHRKKMKKIAATVYIITIIAYGTWQIFNLHSKLNDEKKMFLFLATVLLSCMGVEKNSVGT